MSLFERLFGKNKKESKEKKERAALGLKDDAELSSGTEAVPVEDKAQNTETEVDEPEVKDEKAEAKVEMTEVKAEMTEAKVKKETKKPAGTATAEKKSMKTSEQPKEASAPEEESVTLIEQPPVAARTGEGSTGRFEIKKSKDGRFVFNLYAKNHVIVATSQIYSSSTSAVGGIKSVIANAPIAPIEDQTLKTYETLNFPKWELYQDKGGQYRFRLSAPNGSCICHSQGYTNKTNCKNGIQSIIRSCQDASIDKIYLKKDGE